MPDPELTPDGKPQRNPRGWFQPGNTVSKGKGGNPHARKVVALRAQLFQEITPERFREVILAMHKEATGVWNHLEEKWEHRPNVRAAEWLSDRLIGKPVESGAEDRLRRIEQSLGLSDADLDPAHLADLLDTSRSEGEIPDTGETEEPGDASP